VEGYIWQQYAERQNNPLLGVTRRGIDTAVVVSVKEWRRLSEASRPTLKEVLLGPGPRFTIPLPPRGKGKSRPPVVFD
jgi:hypothetical protein